tara:strand:+ start:133 stop:417 length:285 start_codon:yes stop_codon:yes gene_type:complete
MEEILQKIMMCNEKINEVYEELYYRNLCEFETEEINDMQTNFIIKINNIRMSISIPLDTCQLETVLYEKDGDIDDDSIKYHNDINELISYLENI